MPQLDKDPALAEKEREGQELLHRYTRARSGVQAELIRKTGMFPAVMSRMSNFKAPITLEAAIMLEVATDGELQAEKLCPGRAQLIASFRAPRAKQQEHDAA